MNRFLMYFEPLSLLWERDWFPLLLMGMGVLVANLLWLLANLLYGGVLVYNYHEGKSYSYMGYLWMERKGGRHMLTIPPSMVADSLTTRYKIRTGRLFAGIHAGKPLWVSFGNAYLVCLSISREMVVKNHIAT